jgi:hypothetical protein
VRCRRSPHASVARPRGRYQPTGSACARAWAIGASEALTPWLTELIDRAARRPEGVQGPLTFGDLCAGPGADRATAKPEDAWLRLEMVTTNVTNHRAERLPSASREYYFHAEELRDLFPEAVVRWMIEHPPPLSTQPAQDAIRSCGEG